MAEALLFAAKAGADPAKRAPGADGRLRRVSRILEVHGERMIKRTFDPGFRIELHQKDLNLALSSARALGVSPAEHRHRAGAVQRLRGARRQGLGPLGDGAGAGEAGQLRDRPGRTLIACRLCPRGRIAEGERECAIRPGDAAAAAGSRMRARPP
ncbi:MAG: NAD-binding protein [Comamonadaceae bacterium]|nr:NAD-binding protein [Comamonadaceae bacterium]